MWIGNADRDLLMLGAFLALCGLVPAALAHVRLKSEEATRRPEGLAAFPEAGLAPSVFLEVRQRVRARLDALGSAPSAPAPVPPAAESTGAAPHRRGVHPAAC